MYFRKLEGARTRVRTLRPKIWELASKAQGESVFAVGEIPVATTKHKQEKGALRAPFSFGAGDPRSPRFAREGEDRFWCAFEGKEECPKLYTLYVLLA